MAISCDSCGARLAEGAVVCELCGTPVDGEHETLSEDIAPEMVAPAAHEKEDIFCNSCGWKNPSGANFCSKCGTELQKNVSESEPAQVENPPETSQSQASSAVGKQVVIIVSSALLVVMVLYVITTMSQSSSDFQDAGFPEVSAVQEPLAAQFAQREEILINRLSGLSGDSLIAVRRDLVDLYHGASRLDLAADETTRIAEILNTEDDWTVAGNLYYDWMERKDMSLRAPWARKAVAAYQRALDINPENLDVRTDMAITYMYDPQNSMRAIQETTKVLELDSLHMQANFNRGIMLMQINRNEQAADQFEKVMRIVGDPSDPVYQRADALAKGLKAAALNATE